MTTASSPTSTHSRVTPNTTATSETINTITHYYHATSATSAMSDTLNPFLSTAGQS